MSVGNPIVTSTAEQLALDDLPLKFGKFKGMTPNELYDSGESGYIMWMFKTVTTFATCSPTLNALAKNDLDSVRKSGGGRPRPMRNTSVSKYEAAQLWPTLGDDDDDDIPF